jgi:RNA polymerase sigma-32 factor
MGPHKRGIDYVRLRHKVREERDDQCKEYQYETVELDPFQIYLSDLRKHHVLSREEEQEVAERWCRYKDPDAADKLVASNLRLVVKIALNYRSTYLNILDLVQEGNEGLVRAPEKYDANKGTRFSTYASF